MEGNKILNISNPAPFLIKLDIIDNDIEITSLTIDTRDTNDIDKMKQFLKLNLHGK